MPNLRTPIGAIAAALLLSALPAAAQSGSNTDLYTFSVSLAGGIGGSFDEDQSGYDNTALQLGLSVATESRAEVVARVGRLSFGSTETLGSLLAPELTYATIAGEYTFGELGYESGLFFGFGLYQFEGRRPFTAEAVSTTRFGVTGGVTGEFDLTDRLGFLTELSAHLVPGGEAEILATGLAGLVIHIR